MADYDDPEGNATHAGDGDGRSPPSKRTDGRCPLVLLQIP
jgi:hypothetical protein